MGIFSGTNSKPNEQITATVIPNGAHIIGGIKTEGIIHIDGKFEGVISMAKHVIIGKTGECYGKIEAQNISVNGYVDGKVDCENITILKHGKVKGELKYNHLVIEPDGIFEGQGKLKNYTFTGRYSHVKESIEERIELNEK